VRHVTPLVLTSLDEIHDARVWPARRTGRTGQRDLHAVARTARHGRGHVTLHLPEGWYREHEWRTLFVAACGPPAPLA